MTALLHALSNLARLRWLGAAFCALAIVCATANVNANPSASGTRHEQEKTRVGGFEQNAPLNVCANALASAEVHRGISSAQREAVSAFSHAAEGGVALAKGGAALLRAGLQPFKNTALTVAGRALTKHPELVGLTKATLTQTLRTPAAINAAAEGALKDILEGGTATIRELGRFGMTLEVRGANGFGARFAQATGEFIGFITP